jgi:flavin reductase (DIM6/NTAB) family NADH-FMN oxidoreductase RutF
MKKKIELWEHAGTILSQVAKGALITVKNGDQVNSMTIGWGTLGVEWGRNVFVAFVRQSRHTKAMLDGAGDFTVNIPLGGDVKQILGVCGSKSGRDMDKVAELGLHLEEAEVITSPGIKELPLTLECKILYRMEQTLDTIPQDIIEKYYPNGDFHYAYYGQIVGAYIAE